MLNQLEKTEKKQGISWDPKAVEALCERYRPLAPTERIAQLYEDFAADRVMLTSAFAGTSAFLLHLVASVRPAQTVFFIDTGFHFSETLEYKQHLAQRLGLAVVDVHADRWHHEFTVREKTWLSDPDLCCYVNKVAPLEELQQHYDVWISGLMRWQTDHRATLDIFEVRHGILKFYPLIDVTKDARDAYIREHQLPFHPLVAKGYQSIGCVHCTAPGEDRSGRWNNSPKTECGLHL